MALIKAIDIRAQRTHCLFFWAPPMDLMSKKAKRFTVLKGSDGRRDSVQQKLLVALYILD